jgi:hypothetical protein
MGGEEKLAACPEALEANRKGGLAPPQRAELTARCQRSLIWPAGLGLVSGLIAAVSSAHGLGIGGLISGLAWLAWRLVPLVDLRRGVVLSREGQVRVEYDGRDQPVAVAMGRDVRLTATAALCRTIRPGRDYRVFYIPLSRQVLNVEVLPAKADNSNSDQSVHPKSACSYCGAPAAANTARCRFCGTNLLTIQRQAQRQ